MNLDGVGTNHCLRKPHLNVQIPRRPHVHLDSSAFVTDPDLVRSLQKESISIAGDRDRVLFYQGEEPTGLYILHRGSATLSIRCRERRIDIKVQTTAPSLVGLPSLMDGAPHAFTAVAHGGAELSFVDRNNFACMIESDTLLSLQALGALVAEMAFTSRAILDQIQVEAENAA